MKKLNLKLSAALLTVVLLATAAYIFYACKKDGNSNSDKNLKKETEFVAKIHEKMCVQVNVFRDENDNVHITTKEVGIDPTKSIAVIVPEALSMESQLSKNDESIVIEIPNDAVYWLVPLDGNEPVKFEPVNDTKSASGSSGSITVYCVCTQDRQDCTSGSKCQPPKYIQNEKEKTATILCVPDLTTCCATCDVRYNLSTGASAMTSSYLVKSNTVTVNNAIYK